MPGLGTILNTALIIVGGILGILLKKRVKESMGTALTNVCGVTVIFVAIGGVMEKMLVMEDNAFSTQGSMMMIVSIAIGTVIGELIDIDGKVEKFGAWLKVKSKSEGDNQFISAFVDASCTVCIGAMAIVGSIMDGIYHDYSILLAKGILDFIIICIMAASRGKGAIFSAIPVFLLQGVVTVVAMFAGPFMSDTALNHLSYVGSVMIFCVGLNLIRDKKIRVANMLPGLIICALWP